MPPQFVLVHGAGHGAWCWYKVRCLLETSGYKVTCLDLTGAGIDPTDPNTVFTFEDYNRPLIDFFSNLPDNEKVILVGHSAGGVSVTYCIHRFSNKIQAAIYVAAPMLKPGLSTDQGTSDAKADMSRFAAKAEYGYGLGPDHPPTSSMLEKEFAREILYQMSPPEECTLAMMLRRPAPTRAMAWRGAEASGSDESDQVPRVYIRTLHDRVWKLEKQDDMIERWPPSKVFTLESDHSPFFSAPFALSGLLVQVTGLFH